MRITAFEAVCVFYMLPAALLLVYVMLQQLKAERSGLLLASGRPSLEVIAMCFLPLMNLFALLMLLCMLWLELLWYIRETAGGRGRKAGNETKTED